MIKFSNILYPINLDSKNISTVVTAVEIAGMFNGTLHIFYVNDPAAGYRFPADRADAVSLKVIEAVPADILANKKITYAVSKGDFVPEIKEYCAKNKIDLIVTGHHHRNAIYSMLFDSPDVNIIDSSNIPVLVLPKE